MRISDWSSDVCSPDLAARPDARSGGGGMMRPSRTRLINAARRSMLQRGEFKRKLGIARDAFAPTAFVGRARYRVGEKVDDASHAVREEFRSNRLPIALAEIGRAHVCTLVTNAHN